MAPQSDPDTPTVGRLSAKGLRALLSAGEDLALLDVREPFERAYCAIAVPASARDLFVPTGEVMARVEEIRRAAADGPIVVYCHHGVRSLAVANWLVRQGCNRVFNLEGGIDAWSVRV